MKVMVYFQFKLNGQDKCIKLLIYGNNRTSERLQYSIKIIKKF